MSNQTTLTPETDAAEFRVLIWPNQDHGMVVRADFARTLERERNEWRKKAVELCRQRDKLVEAIRFVLEDSEIACGHFWPDVVKKCKEALAAVEGGKP